MTGQRRATQRRAAIGGLAAVMSLAALSSAGVAAAATPAAAGQVIVKGWGINDDGALGAGSAASDSLLPVKMKLSKGVTIKSIRSGCDGGVALAAGGAVLAWGDNAFGQVGDSTRKNRGTPVRVKLPKGTTVTAVRAGCDDDIALTKTGTVLAWGKNNGGELGDGKTKNSGTPVKVDLPKGTKAKAISAGCQHNLALTTSGKLYAWGANSEGQLGDGTDKMRTKPVAVKIPAGDTVTQVSAGCFFTLALTSDGLFGWGDDSSGQLGDSRDMSQDVPELISFLFRGTGPGTIVSVFAGCAHSIALFSKGGVLAWGDDSVGQLGDGGNMASAKPVGVMLPTGVKVRAISAGCDNGYALTSTGQVYAWGAGDSGELGNGGNSNLNVPVLVHLTGSVATAVGAGPGAFRAFAILATSG